MITYFKQKKETIITTYDTLTLILQGQANCVSKLFQGSFPIQLRRLTSLYGKCNSHHKENIEQHIMSKFVRSKRWNLLGCINYSPFTCAN